MSDISIPAAAQPVARLSWEQPALRRLDAGEAENAPLFTDDGNGLS